MSYSEYYVLWDCRVQRPDPLDLWKLLNDISGGIRPTKILILQPTGTEMPEPLCTLIRMTNSKVFVGEDAVQFAFLEFSLLLKNSPKSLFVMLTDDLNVFVRPFRIANAIHATFVTSKTLDWQFAMAPWASSITFLDPQKQRNNL